MIALGPAGFMQGPLRRTAWCARCDGPQECDERGCTVCAVLREKRVALRALSAARRRARLRADGTCINAISHGPPEEGKTKCMRCLEVHRKSNKRVP